MKRIFRLKGKIMSKKVYIVTNHDTNYSTAIKLSDEQVKAIQWFIDLDDVIYSVCLPEDCCCDEIQQIDFHFIYKLERWIENIYVENIVIGNPIVEPSIMFSADEEGWNRVKKKKTYYTEERFSPRILVDIGIYPSVNEIRRNKPELMVELSKLGFIDNLKVSKK